MSDDDPAPSIKLLSPPGPFPPSDPGEVLEKGQRMLIGVERIVVDIDQRVRSFDQKMQRGFGRDLGDLRPPDTPSERRASPDQRRQREPSPAPSPSGGEGYKSHEGQDAVDYCFECLEKHFLKADALLQEAEDRSLKSGQGVSDKVRGAIRELVAAEDDMADQRFEDPEMQAKMDRIRQKAREIRKRSWSNRATLDDLDDEDIRELRDEMKDLVDTTYGAAEYYVAESQTGTIASELEDMGVPEEVSDDAAEVVGAFAAGQVPRSQAEEALSEVIGQQMMMRKTDNGLEIRSVDE